MGGEDGQFNALLPVALCPERPVALHVGLGAQGHVAVKGHRDRDFIGVKMIHVAKNDDDGAVVHHIRHAQHRGWMIVGQAVRVQRNAIES